MTQQTILTTDYLDIVFAGRNKAYGAYNLRRHYQNQVYKAAGFILLCFSLLLFYSLSRKADYQQLTTVATVCTISEPPVIISLQRKPSLKPSHAPAPASSGTARPAISEVPRIVANDDIQEDETRPMQPADAAHGQGNDGDDAEKNSGGGGGGPDDGGSGGGEGGDTHEETLQVQHYAEVMPAFEGSLRDYLMKNLRYPEAARNNETEGKVTVEFIVNTDGSVTDIKVRKGIGSGCDQEAVRVVANMPRWKPGRQNGKAVPVYFVLPISFMLQ